MNWLEKYRPKSFDEINIQLDIKKKMEEWLILFRNRQTTNNFLYLYGVPGSGKTTMANLLLKKYNYDILEWNVIDLKQSKNLDETLEKVIKRKNINVLIKQRKVYSAIILEECDCLANSGRELIYRITETFKNLEDLVPIICTSNELEDILPTNYKNCYNLYFSPLSKEDIIITYTHIKNIDKWKIDKETENKIIECLFDKLDTDLRQWLIHLENIIKLNKNDINFDKFIKYWETIDKKNKNYTNYEIVEKIYKNEFDIFDNKNYMNVLIKSNMDMIVPMICYSNINIVENKIKYNDINDFLLKKQYLSENYIQYETMRNYKYRETIYDIDENINKNGIYIAISTICYFSKKQSKVKKVNKDNNKSIEITYPSIIYNKKYTECSHRKIINNLSYKYDLSYNYIKMWGYCLYNIYNIDNIEIDDYMIIELFSNYSDIFGNFIDIEDIYDIFKCDYLISIKKNNRDYILKNIYKKLYGYTINNLNRNNIYKDKDIDKNIIYKDINKCRGRPSKNKLKLLT